MNEFFVDGTRLFDFYDVDHDGKISIVDMVMIQANLPWDSELGEEIQKLLSEYVNQIILSNTRVRVIFSIDFGLLNALLPHSWVVKEFLNNVLILTPEDTLPKISKNKVEKEKRK